MQFEMRRAWGVILVLLILVRSETGCLCSQDVVRMTVVEDAPRLGAFCLDGSLPGYHLDRGFGAGARNWLLQFEGGGWCNDVQSCLERAQTRRGSTRYMNKGETFSGILSSNASLNPGLLSPAFIFSYPRQSPSSLLFHLIYILCVKSDFYNWNRVKLRYCDGGSFTGDAMFNNGTSVLYFRGQKIWEAIILDLLPKGLGHACKALLSGCSAGGLSALLHCDNFTGMLPKNASVKCLSDAGFFLDEKDINSNYTMRSFFERLVSLQGAEKNLNKNCTSVLSKPKLCIFPQYVLKYTTTPLFILNTAYDVYQFHHILVPPAADFHGHWMRCKLDIASCDETQIDVLQGFRREMLAALLSFFRDSRRGGMFINSCFAHCQSESQDTWLAIDSPRIHNKSIAEAVGDWYFSRNITKEIDCPYPCDSTCHNTVSSG